MIVCRKGHAYDLTKDAVLSLLAAKTADVADSVFNELAPQVPRKDRLEVWLAVEQGDANGFVPSK